MTGGLAASSSRLLTFCNPGKVKCYLWAVAWQLYYVVGLKTYTQKRILLTM